MRTIRTKVYKFSELSESAKQTAIDKLFDINVTDEWWDGVYEDAKNIGLQLTEFNIDRGSYCKGYFMDGAQDTANEILKQHGEKCQTYTTAKEFLESVKTAESTIPVIFEQGTPEEYEDYVEREEAIEELEDDFLKSILEDYRIILQKEYEYLTSKDAIIESIKANEYEFTKDGKQF